jgi:hypothetical protein
MLLQLLLGPFAALYTCGLPGLLLVPTLVGGALVLYLAAEVTPEIGTADLIVASVASALVGLWAVLLMGMTVWRNPEALFVAAPWRAGAGAGAAPRCAFTGARPTRRCPSCHARVAEGGWHGGDRLVGGLGATVLRWDSAKAAVAAGEGGAGGADAPARLGAARAALDEALDLRGNFLSCAVGPCCVGCATWFKAFSLAPRLSMSLALAALFLAFLPWAFLAFLDLIGGLGAALKVVTGSAAAGFAGAALLVQARALGRAAAFMARHSARLPTLRPRRPLPLAGAKGALVRVLCATPWDPLL